MSWPKLLLTLVLGVYFVRCLFNPHEYLAIYGVDFVFHEAGHVFFMPFGKFLQDLGGTLMQLALPITAAGYFLMKGKFHSCTIIFYWIGENFVNISIYARDARARLLPLHGGDNVTHDWSEILYTVNLLHRDQAVGNFFFGLAILCMVVALAGGIYLAFHPEYEHPTLE